MNEQETTDESEAARAITAESARILEDSERIDKTTPTKRKIAAMLVAMSESFASPGTKVGSLKTSIGTKDNSIVLVFHRMMGKTPGKYLEEARVNVARHLLVTTKMKAWKVAEVCGYSNLSVFSRAFSRASGLRPIQYRMRFSGEPGQQADGQD